MSPRKIKVIVVDDSKLFSKFLSEKLNEDNYIEVVGIAKDPYEARDKILSLKPDVLTLDVEMPKMDGIEFLKKLLPQYPISVIMVSSVNEKVFEALEAGAVDFVDKPSGKTPEDLGKFVKKLIESIKVGFISKQRRIPIRNNESMSRENKNVDREIIKSRMIVIGASTGGTNALKEIITSLPKDFPPIVINSINLTSNFLYFVSSTKSTISLSLNP
ncbi:response regulator, partial [Clostridiaceae bacterium HSG29]|nr:response regulator [Clostridiaceae bacterium HSG29]